jgi:VCBS repeat-containing protein
MIYVAVYGNSNYYWDHTQLDLQIITTPTIASGLSDTGSIAFTDLDLTDRPTATEATKSVVALKADGAALTLTTAQQQTFEAAFTIAPADGNNNNGIINWNYSIAEGSLDFLADGEKVTAVFTVSVSDGNGGTASQDVTVNITGNNDLPSITTVENVTDVTGAVTEDAASPTLSDTGIITFNDVDLTDAHTVLVVRASGTLGGVLTLGSISESATTSAGSVPWTYTVDNIATQYLAAGQTASEVFTVTINDGKGGTVAQNIMVTATGINDNL